MSSSLSSKNRTIKLTEVQRELFVTSESLYPETINEFQRIYSEKSEIVDYMLRFGSPIEKKTAELIKSVIKN